MSSFSLLRSVIETANAIFPAPEGVMNPEPEVPRQYPDDEPHVTTW